MAKEYLERNKYKNLPKEELSEDDLHKLEVTRRTRKNLAASLTVARNEAGLTQEQLKDITGLSQSQICRLEGGRLNMCIDDLALVADAYGYKIVAIKK